MIQRLFGIVHRGETENQLVQRDASFALVEPESGKEKPSIYETILERNTRVGTGRAHGEGVFDFRYGPFTGGLGETGVLHLSTYGEKILAVDIDLSFKHRGVERTLRGLPVEKGTRTAACVCGNFAVTHADAFAGAVEQAAGLLLSEGARRARVIALELERVYNHLYVISRLADAAAQRVLAAHLGALFEESLRINALWSGNRFLRGIRVPGGARVPPRGDFTGIASRIDSVRAKFSKLYAASLSNRNYLDRLHGIATVDADEADFGSLTGPSLRAAVGASTIGARADSNAGATAARSLSNAGPRDIRPGAAAHDLRSLDETLDGFTAVTRGEGDSLARMEVRAEEILQACGIIIDQIEGIAAGARYYGGVDRAESRGAVDDAGGSRTAGTTAALKQLTGSGIGASEGPSGAVVWWVDVRGGVILDAYVSTPCFFGYHAFAAALTGHIFTDFPFALDSFGLSFADAAR